MRIKDKFIKQKQLTDRPQASVRNTDSTPLLTRLQKQYLFNQPNLQKTMIQNNYYTRGGEKENYANMVNSVPIPNEFVSHNVIKIDNYEGRRFKTQHGYEPMMTKSRYMGDKQENQQVYESTAMYKSVQGNNAKKQKSKKAEERTFQSIDFSETQRPLTFGLIRKTEPMKSSVQYQEDVRMKNEILNQISSLRRSQQTLIASKDYSASGIGDVARCVNHNNKKAKYKLLADSEGKQEQDMIYCSKCAINLLQQGFKVEQIKHGVSLNRKLSQNQQQFMCQANKNMLGSVGSSSRLQEMRNFEQKLSQIENKINNSLEQSSLKTNQIEQIERQIWQTESLYEQMIEHLQQTKTQQINQLNHKKQKRIGNLQVYHKQLSQELENIHDMKKEMNEFRNKFIIMKQNEFQFLISSFLNKIQSYGSKYQQNQVNTTNIDDQINQIIIDLCEFCKQIKQDEQHHNQQQSAFAKKKKRKENWNQQSQDDFICKQIKGPFRTLFPEEESNPPSQRKEKCQQFQAEQDSPSFNKYQTHGISNQMRKSNRNTGIFRQ